MQLIFKDSKKLNLMRNLFFLLLLFLVYSCEDENQVQVHQGYALGTTYTVQYRTINTSVDDVQNGIDSLFTVINKSMSTYIPNSDISKINQGDTTVVVDIHFKNVFYKAKEVWELTNGFFDPTVGAWVNAYGFGPEKPVKLLTDEKKRHLSQITGWNNIKLNDNLKVTKKFKETYIDFNALAKGYAVDLIGDYIASLGSLDYLVEIGGEIVAHGISPNSGNPWRIAIDDPKQKTERRSIQQLTLTNEAIATSGNYRKFRIDSLTGERYVHSINPLTGEPVKSNVLSTSVKAIDCMTADAYATALMVLPFEKSKVLIDRLPNIEAYWIIASKDTIQEFYSRGWNK